jgi:predicted RNA-binding protein YlqC (UPF0109 family)
MKETLNTIIESIVSEPSKVSIKEVEKEGNTVFEVKVAETDMGKVIGKEGRIAKSIRTIMKGVASKENKRVNIEFIG